jgi:hypothetical protein
MAKKLDDMMGAMGEMPAAGEEPEGAPASKPMAEGPSEVSEEEMMHAEDMGFDGKQAAALKRFIKSCMASEESGEYEEEQAPSVPADMGDI